MYLELPQCLQNNSIRARRTTNLKLSSKIIILGIRNPNLLTFLIPNPVPPPPLQNRSKSLQIKNKKIAPGALSPSSEGVRIFCWVFSNSENHAPCVGDVFKAFPALYRHEQSPIQFFVHRVPKYSGFRLEFSEQTLKGGSPRRLRCFFKKLNTKNQKKIVDFFLDFIWGFFSKIFK